MAEKTTRPPKVFISYAWEDDLKTWVLEFAARLRSDGINAILDQWETVAGDQLPEFMERSVRDSDFVVFVCTPTYKRKSDRRKGGVGYEGHIITGEIFSKNNHRKFIPVLRKGKWVSAAPSWATSKLFIDFRGGPYSEESYQQLLDNLFGRSPTAPPLREEKLENARKEEVKKRRPSFFETPVIRKSAIQQDAENPNNVANKPKESIPLSESLVGHEIPESGERLSRKKLKAKKPIKTEYIVAIITAIATIVAGLLGSPTIEKWFSSAPIPTQLATITLTLTSRPIDPTQTTEIGATPTEIYLPTATPMVSNPYPDSSDYIDSFEVPMRLIPAGNFIMGSNDGEDDEKPIQTIYLEGFYLDKYEVTNALYKSCVNAGVCNVPKDFGSRNRSTYYDDAQFANYPVVFVDWNMANTFCEWRQARLPTEAEWEKAARGIDGRTYPWGENIDITLANYSQKMGDTTPIGKYFDGKSPYGVYDLAGNVWEWVSSVYEPYPYIPTDGREDLTITNRRVLRGGAWQYFSFDVRGANRGWDYQNGISYDFGFRCARDG